MSALDTARQIAEEVRAGTRSAREVTEAALEAVGADEPAP